MSITPEEAPPRPAYMRDAAGLYYRIASPNIGTATTIITGSGVPDGSTGSLGHYYLDTDGKILYGPKAVAPAEVWPVALRSAAQEITSSTTAPSSPEVGDIWVDMN